MPGETSQGTRGDSLIIGSRRFGSPPTRDSPEVGIVAQGVPADIADAQPFRHRFDEHPHDRHWPVRLPRFAPARGESLANTLSGFLYGVILYQANNSSIMKGHRSLRCLCFDLTRDHLNNRPSDAHLFSGKIDVPPLQPDQLTIASNDRG